MHACMHAHIHTYTKNAWVCLHTNVHTYIHHTFIYAYIHTYAHMYIHTYICVYIHTCYMNKCGSRQILQEKNNFIYIYIYIYIYIHIYTWNKNSSIHAFRMHVHARVHVYRCAHQTHAIFFHMPLFAVCVCMHAQKLYKTNYTHAHTHTHGRVHTQARTHIRTCCVEETKIFILYAYTDRCGVVHTYITYKQHAQERRENIHGHTCMQIPDKNCTQTHLATPHKQWPEFIIFFFFKITKYGQETKICLTYELCVCACVRAIPRAVSSHSKRLTPVGCCCCWWWWCWFCE